MLALAWLLTAAALFFNFFLPAALAVVPVGFLLIGALACLALLGIHNWKTRD